MSVLSTKTTFNMDFVGEVVTENGAVVKMGKQHDGAMPYDLLLGALSSCLYATFLGVAEKKRLTFEKVVVEASGEKRTDVPTTLKWVKVKMIIHKPSATKGFDQAAKLAADYCSIYQTISKVADMSISVEFIDA